jgi:CRP/FNR family cyclic AMP-dependent transcriptional regulator
MATHLALHPFLVGMNRRHLALLADCATRVQFKEGQVIFREGDVADRFYLIETGTVTVESSGGIGDPMLGWSWMFPPHIRSFTARASELTTAIFFDGPILRECCETDPSFGYEFLKRMSLLVYKRMQASRNANRMQRGNDTVEPNRGAALNGARARSLESAASKVT